MGHATRRPSRTELAGSSATTLGAMYEIVVRGRLGRRWADDFDGFEVIDAGDGTTVLRGRPQDQATLFGALGRVRDLGIPLLAVRRVEP